MSKTAGGQARRARRRASARRRIVVLSSLQTRAEAPVSEAGEAKARSTPARASVARNRPLI